MRSSSFLRDSPAMLITRLIDGRLSKTDVSKRERTRVVGAALGKPSRNTANCNREGATRGRDVERGVVLRYERHFSCQFANY